MTTGQNEISNDLSFSFIRFLTVAEQMTTYSQSADMTATLNVNSYWASYNNIYFPNFRNISGEEAKAKKIGPELYSWYNSSRAQIFRRDHEKIVDLPTMIHMMRYKFQSIVFCIEKFDFIYIIDTMILNMTNYRHAIALHRIPQY